MSTSTQKRHDIERNNFDVKFRLYQLGEQLERGEESWSDISQSLSELREQLEFSHTGLRELGCAVDAARDYNAIVDEYHRTLHRADANGVQSEEKANMVEPLVPPAKLPSAPTSDPDPDPAHKPQSPPQNIAPRTESAVAVDKPPKHDETRPETAPAAAQPPDQRPDVSPVGQLMRHDDADQGPQQAILSTNAKSNNNDTIHSTPTRPGSQSRSPAESVEFHRPPPPPPLFSPPPADPFSADSSDLRYQALVQENKDLRRQLDELRQQQQQQKQQQQQQQPESAPVDAFELCNLRTALDSLTQEQIRQHLDQIIERHPKTDKDKLITILKHSYQRVKTQRDNLKIIRSYQSQQLHNYKIATNHRIKLLRSFGLDYQPSSGRPRPTFVSTIWAIRFMIRLRKTTAQTLQKQAFIRTLLEQQS